MFSSWTPLITSILTHVISYTRRRKDNLLVNKIREHAEMLLAKDDNPSYESNLADAEFDLTMVSALIVECLLTCIKYTLCFRSAIYLF